MWRIKLKVIENKIQNANKTYAKLFHEYEKFAKLEATIINRTQIKAINVIYTKSALRHVIHTTHMRAQNVNKFIFVFVKMFRHFCQ